MPQDASKLAFWGFFVEGNRTASWEIPMHDPSSALVDEREAAAILTVAPRTLQHWRWARRGPTFVKIGGAVRYNRNDLREFLERARREPAQEKRP